MPIRVDGRIQRYVILAIIAHTLIGVVTLHRTAAMARDARAVARALQTGEQLREVAATMSDAESGALGFVISSDSTFLSLFDSSRISLPLALEQLDALTLDDERQQALGDSLGFLIAAQLSEFQRMVELRQAADAGTMVELGESGRGLLMGRIREVIAAMVQADEVLLAEGARVLERRTLQMQVVVVGGALVAIAIAVVAGSLIRRELGARRRAEGVFRTVVESVPGGVLMVSRDGTIALANREAERLFGYSPQELQGQSIEQLVPSEFRSAHPGFRRDFFTRPQSRPMGVGRDLFGQRKDGTQVPVEIGLNPIETEDGLFVLASVVDITERRRAEVQFRTMVESAPSGMVMIDRAGTITLTNRAAEKLFGYTRDELVGASIDRLVPPRFRTLHPTHRGDFFSNPHPRAMGAGRDLFGIRKDGVEIPVEIGLNPIETEEGMVVLASIVDITARKQGELELRRSNEELERFAYVASHDLQEPLRMVGSYVQLLAKRYRGRLDADADEFIGFALDGALRMQQLIEDLLAYSRVGTRGNALVSSDSGAVVDRVIATLRLSIEEAGARINVGPLPQVQADPSQLEHLFQNLISNAIKFRGDASPEIEVSAIRKDREWVFSVQDNGIGIDPQYFDRVFVIFQRLHGREDYPGTGIGLAIAKKIVERHGGQIWVESVPGEGTKFSFTLQSVRDET